MHIQHVGWRRRRPPSGNDRLQMMGTDKDKQLELNMCATMWVAKIAHDHIAKCDPSLLEESLATTHGAHED